MATTSPFSARPAYATTRSIHAHDPSLPHSPTDTFLEDQQSQCQHAAKAFEQIVDKLQALVEKVCKDVTTRARVNEDTPVSSVR